VSTRDLVRQVERALADGRLIALRQAHRTRLGTSAPPSPSLAGGAPTDITAMFQAADHIDAGAAGLYAAEMKRIC